VTFEELGGDNIFAKLESTRSDQSKQGRGEKRGDEKVVGASDVILGGRSSAPARSKKGDLLRDG